MTTTSPAHAARIRQQFDLQAVPYSQARMAHETLALALLLEAAQARPGLRSLDVACGPGRVALAFADVVADTTGLDMAPRMLDRARELAAEKGRSNIAWDIGDALALPYADATFDVVTTRLSWHHLEVPERALDEMVRVCKPGGRIVVCDAVAPADAGRAVAFLAMERLRDPSTTRFLTQAEMMSLLRGAGLEPDFVRSYSFVVALEPLLRASFPDPGGAERIRRLVHASLDDDALGMAAKAVGGDVQLQYSAVVFGMTRPPLAGARGSGSAELEDRGAAS
jgi:ubiquinone/menaquinone biosynthesis C-methylase UbiE